MVATPPEEISKQHQAACRLLGEKRCAPSVCHGEIPLEWKQYPTSENPTGFQGEEKKTQEWNGCVSTRGFVDVTALANLCREGYNQSNDSSTTINPKNLWSEKNAAENNVAVTRPSHDNWGIQKIVFMFCDDFLTKVYVMPWWHLNSEVRDAVRPVLETLNICPQNVVRMLLANLPPSTTIPVHHDTGSWVQYTHRVHVPVLVEDPELILFTCGPTRDKMERIDCREGHVFEINNQAKHAVSNCSTTHHRVHLILDYVDFDQQRIRLQPGERLLQTRRSIDRALDYGKRPSPTFMILGAQKAGTTSLYNYMTQHPLVIPAKRRETHCLDWRWKDCNNNVMKQRQHCLEFYHYKELKHHPSCLTGDSTPSYLLDSVRVIPRLQQVFEHYRDMKFFVMLRNPADRAQSHYAMVTSMDGTPQQIKARGTEWRSKTFEEVVKEDFTAMRRHGLIPYWDCASGVVNQDVFDAFVGSPQEDAAWERYLKEVPLNTGSHSLVSRGMYELNLRPWLRVFERKQFLILTLDELKNVQDVMPKVWNHLELPPYRVEDESAKNTRAYSNIMKPETKAMLERFYEPHNRRLQQLLGKQS